MPVSKYLTEQSVLAIFAQRPADFTSGSEPASYRKCQLSLADKYRVSRKTIREIWKRRTWAGVTAHLCASPLNSLSSSTTAFPSSCHSPSAYYTDYAADAADNALNAVKQMIQADLPQPILHNVATSDSSVSLNTWFSPSAFFSFPSSSNANTLSEAVTDAAAAATAAADGTMYTIQPNLSQPILHPVTSTTASPNTLFSPPTLLTAVQAVPLSANSDDDLVDVVARDPFHEQWESTMTEIDLESMVSAKDMDAYAECEVLVPVLGNAKTPRTRLTHKMVVDIYAIRPPRSPVTQTFAPCTQITQAIAAQYDVRERTVRDIWNRHSWREITRPLWSPAEIAADLLTAGSVPSIGTPVSVALSSPVPPSIVSAQSGKPGRPLDT